MINSLAEKTNMVHMDETHKTWVYYHHNRITLKNKDIVKWNWS